MILKRSQKLWSNTKGLNGAQPKEVFVDRGCRGVKEYNSAKISTPKPDKNITKEKRKGHIQRAGIEPVIGHLKQSDRGKSTLGTPLQIHSRGLLEFLYPFAKSICIGVNP